MDDDPLLHLAKEAFAKYDINASGTIDQKVHTITPMTHITPTTLTLTRLP